MPGGSLRKALGVRDLALFYIATSFSIRWIATAAAGGPSALVIWVMAALCLFVPLVFTVLELSSRYPEEGGVYIWSKHAFGPFAGFITGWTYWGSNLPYLPGLLFFAAGNALFIGGPAWQTLEKSGGYFIAFGMIGLALTVAMNVVGLDVGKWLTNIGGVALWVPTMAIIVLGAMSRSRFGAATPITPSSLVPSLSLKDVVFWSTVAFAFAGVENASTMGDEIKDARRTVPRALLVAGASITVMYIAATYFVLMALPKEQISGIGGIMQAIQVMTARVGVGWSAPIFAALVTMSAIGGVGGWFAATARLPFVAGIDRFLPPAFGDLHPKWGTPHVALLVQAAICALFIVLAKAGTSVEGAYDLLVSMGIIGQFIPYLYMFAALIKVQRTPAAMVLGSLGFVVSTAAIVLACVPAGDDPNKLLTVVKIVGTSIALLVIGAFIYWLGTRRRPA
ncbi:MAG TPA: APC family permease [Vicinamibacterales bacterium]|nr:APC family permease [Vicinamibacterales bacterium]